jgi:alanine dehydrogenase
MLSAARFSYRSRAPTLLSRKMLSMMKRGAAFVDVSIDRGGCFETLRPTTQIAHRAVADSPGMAFREVVAALAA